MDRCPKCDGEIEAFYLLGEMLDFYYCSPCETGYDLDGRPFSAAIYGV